MQITTIPVALALAVTLVCLSANVTNAQATGRENPIRPGKVITVTGSTFSGIEEREFDRISSAAELERVRKRHERHPLASSVEPNFEFLILIAVFEGKQEDKGPLQLVESKETDEAIEIKYRQTELNKEAPSFDENKVYNTSPCLFVALGRTSKPIVILEGVEKDGEVKWIKRATLK